MNRGRTSVKKLFSCMYSMFLLLAAMGVTHSLVQNATASVGSGSKRLQGVKEAMSAVEIDLFLKRLDTRRHAPILLSSTLLKPHHGLNLPDPPPVGCLPQAQGCVDAVCENLPKYQCDDLSEIRVIAESCRGNYSGDCVKSACDHLPNYLCDDVSEVTAIAKACRGNFSPCVDSVCGYLPRYLCDDASEITRIAESCANVDASCVKDTCGRLPRYACDDLQEVLEVARLCGGSS